MTPQMRLEIENSPALITRKYGQLVPFVLRANMHAERSRKRIALATQLTLKLFIPRVFPKMSDQVAPRRKHFRTFRALVLAQFRKMAHPAMCAQQRGITKVFSANFTNISLFALVESPPMNFQGTAPVKNKPTLATRPIIRILLRLLLSTLIRLTMNTSLVYIHVSLMFERLGTK